jgi:hypothetical protein
MHCNKNKKIKTVHLINKKNINKQDRGLRLLLKATGLFIILINIFVFFLQ